jgi:hypothetical protein
MTHKTKLKCRSGDTGNPELVFRRELVLANCREDVTVEKVLSAISPKVLNLFAFIDCNKGMSSLITVVLEISKSGQCLYYRNVKTLSKRQNGTVDPSLFSLHLIEGRVIPDWKKFISSGENIIRFLGDYKACHL